MIVISFSNIAGLKEDVIVCPFITGDVDFT